MTEKDPHMPPASNEGNDRQSVIIPVIKEVLEIGKEVIETGKVKVTKRVVTETNKIDIPLTSEQLQIERIPRGNYVETAPPAVRYEGDTIIIPVLKEEYVKRIVLVEEIRITRRIVSSEFVQDVTLRREEVEVTHKEKEEINNESKLEDN